MADGGRGTGPPGRRPGSVGVLGPAVRSAFAPVSPTRAVPSPRVPGRRVGAGGPDTHAPSGRSAAAGGAAEAAVKAARVCPTPTADDGGGRGTRRAGFGPRPTAGHGRGGLFGAAARRGGRPASYGRGGRRPRPVYGPARTPTGGPVPTGTTPPAR